MNPYKKLMSNTAIFAIGTFSSKLLVFFMTRYYTAVLTADDFGLSNTITMASNILLPIASVTITDAVIRFGLDKSNNKHEVFSTGLFAILIGFVITLPFAPLVNMVGYLGDYTALMYAYVFAANLQSLCGQCVRTRGHVKLYAFDGIFRTISTIILNIIFLSAFHLGITGYVLSVICANFLSILFLTAIDGLYRFIHIRALNRSTIVNMLRYSIPLIPSKICVYIYSSADSFFILYMVGKRANGLYNTAHKIPTLLILVSGIFIEAMQISAFSSDNRKEQEKFFTRVGNVYQALIFMFASGIIMTSKLSMSIIAAPSYYEGWRFIPLLIFASAFACLSNFQNIIYGVVKKSVSSLTTTLFGAGMNILLNFIFVPKWGANGAAFATLISYIAMFLVRAVHTRRYLAVHWNIPRFFGTFLLLCLQSALMLHEGTFWIPVQILLFLLITLIGAKDILAGLSKVLKRG
ncbi:oligosaccharide flippase family protein [Intestinibacillus massiliensis]|uniref:oligosaccharide flippase family protein n=1 Tax=Intestinibacillus massiliensis TaxID=1871029 RepID=UPI000B34C613|nr:polysaccharide biosynthesis C-terminal domain-containing protein [Intestinibacillus massiliensis]